MKHVLTIAVVGGLWLGAVAPSQAQIPQPLENPPAAASPMLTPSGPSSDLGLPSGALYGSSTSTPGVTGGAPAGVAMMSGMAGYNPYFYGVSPYGAPGVSLNDTINCGGRVPPRLVCVGYTPGPVYCGPQYQQCGQRAPFRCNYRVAFGGILP